MSECVHVIGGGLAGLVVGVAIPIAITFFTAMPTVIQPYSMLLAFGISVALAILTALFFKPANRPACHQ